VASLVVQSGPRCNPSTRKFSLTVLQRTSLWRTNCGRLRLQIAVGENEEPEGQAFRSALTMVTDENQSSSPGPTAQGVGRGPPGFDPQISPSRLGKNWNFETCTLGSNLHIDIPPYTFFSFFSYVLSPVLPSVSVRAP